MSDTEVSAVRQQMLEEMEEMQDRMHTIFSGNYRSECWAIV